MACLLRSLSTRFSWGKDLIKVSLINSNHTFVDRFHSSSKICGVKPMELKMPALSPTMTEGTIVKWLKKEGDPVNPGDALCEIQTDKAVVSFDVEEPGTVAKIIMPENSKDVKIGTLIALMVEEGEDWKDVEVPIVSSSAQQEAPKAKIEQQQRPIQPQTEKPKQHHGPTGSFGPAVKLLLQLYDLQPSKISATGPHGKLLKSDVLSFITSNKLIPGPPKIDSIPQGQKPKVVIAAVEEEKSYEDIPNSSMRQAIAKRLTESKASIPHAYEFAEYKVDNLIEIRKKLKEEEKVNISVNDLIIKAVAVALQRVPRMNSQYVGDEVKPLSTIDISVAVATDKGLITPIVKDASTIGIGEISQRVKDLAERAKIGKLKLDEFQGGSFTISNLGMFGISHFTAIINPPQCAILAVGTSRKVFEHDGNVNTKMTVALSYDRRVVDESEAGSFLSELGQAIEQPSIMISGAP